MDFFDLREPINAWSHFSWLVLSVPGTWLLWQLSRGDRSKQLSLLVYGLTLAFCFASSTLYHGVRLSASWIDGFNRLDHIAIFVLIAGSYTPITLNLLRGRTRWAVLAAAWLFAAVCGVRIVTYGLLTTHVSTALYLAMGWCAIFCYVEMARFLSHRTLFPLLLGGMLYSAGAMINVLRWPVLWPGVFGSHELFHVLVMAGSLAHFWFMLTAVVPFAWAPPRPLPRAGIRVSRPTPYAPVSPPRTGAWRAHLCWVIADKDRRPPQRRRMPPTPW
jgi:hemolysin III